MEQERVDLNGKLSDVYKSCLIASSCKDVANWRKYEVRKSGEVYYEDELVGQAISFGLSSADSITIQVDFLPLKPVEYITVDVKIDIMYPNHFEEEK